MYQPQTVRKSAVKYFEGAIFSRASFGFMPAFKNLITKETHLSTYDDGIPSVVHVIDGLPGHWVAEWGDDGRAISLKSEIIPGFMRNGSFFTLNAIMYDLCDG